jgi:hypothetical protein
MFENKCFIICPIGKPDSEIRKRADIVFENLIKPAFSELGIEPVRADHIELPGLITKHVTDYLCEAPLVLADLTGNNPNVFYELGIRHTLGKPAIHIVDAHEILPFDLKGMRTIIFDYKNDEGIEEARKEVLRQARLILSSTEEHSLPVLELFGFDLKTPDSLIIDAAREMRKEYHKIIDNQIPPIRYSDFADVDFLVRFIRRIDPDNGHAHYYAGEIKRMADMKDEAIREFLNYLETYENRPSIDMIDDTGAEICYRIAHGYCKQRTGWIHHLLAVYFMNDCEKEREATKIRILAGRASLYANNALKFYPKGFTQYIPTVSIIDKAEKIVKKDQYT